VPGAADELTAIAEQLSTLAEQLGDLAIDRLRAAMASGDEGAAELARVERRITRARRSVEKAAALLTGPDGAAADGP
jgi:hypothetical protein